MEVAVDRDRCFVDGRCATAGAPLSREDVERTVRAVYGRAGFGLGFPGAADESDWQCPRGDARPRDAT